MDLDLHGYSLIWISLKLQYHCPQVNTGWTGESTVHSLVGYFLTTAIVQTWLLYLYMHEMYYSSLFCCPGVIHLHAISRIKELKSLDLVGICFEDIYMRNVMSSFNRGCRSKGTFVLALNMLVYLLRKTGESHPSGLTVLITLASYRWDSPLSWHVANEQI